MNSLQNQPAVFLSIVIVNFETPDYTLECIRSIYRNSPRTTFEVIVIDNGSSDGSLNLIRKEAPQVICIETGQNLGFAQANNLGINNARGEVILLLNSDAKILDNSIDRMLDYLMANPEIGALGPRQIDGEGKLQLSWGAFPTLISEALRKLIHYRLSVNDVVIRDYLEEKYAGSNNVDWVSGSCLMARRDAFLESGLFDEYFFMYFEDIDLCQKIRQKGWQIHYCSDMTILHYGGVSARKNILRILIEYRRSQMYFTRKYYGFGGALVLRLLLLFKYGTNFVKWGLAFLGGKVLQLETKSSYAKLLLTKKTIELVIGIKPADIGTSR